MADREEYERVANELLPMLYKMAMGILHNDADARDAVQQALDAVCDAAVETADDPAETVKRILEAIS